MSKFRNSQKGQALPSALILLAIGSLLVGSLLSYTGTNLKSSKMFMDLKAQQYSADAGIEDAIGNLLYGNFTTTVLQNPGDSYSYTMNDSVNNILPTITLIRRPSSINIVSNDNFETGWGGGNGWLAAWTHTGNSNITPSQSPYEGKYDLMLRSSTGYTARSVNLSGKSGCKIQFWAKVKEFESGDKAYCRVSSNGTAWTTVKTWTVTESDDIYHFYDIDLSPYTMSNQFWVAFVAGMDQNADYFFIDDLKIIGAVGSDSSNTYDIISSAGKKTIKAVVSIKSPALTINSWIVN